MNSAFDTIKKYDLFSKNEIIGVACSGGSDSICLLDFLFKNKNYFEIDVVAINVDHSIRKNSANDSEFVENFCNKNGIKLLKTKVDCFKLKEEKKLSSVEESARIARYDYFNSLLNNNVVDKICLAHHMSDQAETVLLNIFRGSGLQGAVGMKVVQNRYIRPLLYTSKQEIMQYIEQNNLSFVTDETNFDTHYSRNFIRQDIFPLLKTKWPNIEKNITDFSLLCKTDNDYIASSVPYNDFIIENDIAKIPLNVFKNETSVSARAIKYCLDKIKGGKDVDYNHYNSIIELAKKENGAKINIPNNLICQKEYNYITIYSQKHVENENVDFTLGKIIFGEATIECTLNKEKDQNSLMFDLDKLPKNCVWRKRKNGDIFQKFNSGTKKLKEFFIDKKIPSRLRDTIPVLAYGNEILICGNIEISEKIKIDTNTKNVAVLKIDKNYKE